MPQKYSAFLIGTYASFHISTLYLSTLIFSFEYMIWKLITTSRYLVCDMYCIFWSFLFIWRIFPMTKNVTLFLKNKKIEFWTHCWHFENTLFLPHCFCLHVVRERNWNSLLLCLYFLHTFYKKNKLKIIIILPVLACHHFSLNKPILQPKKWLWKE